MNSWPDWQKQATKGDVVSALVSVQSVFAQLAGAIVAMRTQDEQELKDRLDAFFEGSQDLDKLINRIGGADADV